MVTKKGKKLLAVILAAALMVEPVAQQTVYAQKVRYHYAGDKENTAVTVETEVQIQGREESSFTLNDAPYEVGMAFHADQSYDYEATAKAIYEAGVAETNPEKHGTEIKNTRELPEKYTNSAVQKFFFELLRQLTRQSQTDYDGCK